MIDRLVGTVRLPNEGLYRVEAKSGGIPAVTEVIMVARAAATAISGS
jgi:hypothetical protein